MLGAIIGDIAGSAYEFNPWQGHWKDIPLFSDDSEFTDDTILTFAIADALMQGVEDEETTRKNIIDHIHIYGHAYPSAGYGSKFAWWLMSRQRNPYNSFGNGSAMRVSSVGWAFSNLKDVEKFAELTAAVTHNHPEGIKGAQSVAGAIFLARNGADKAQIKDYVSQKYGYDLERTLEQIRQTYRFNETCQNSVPEAIIAFLESDNFEEAIRKAIWLRGDADTQAAIAGSIAEAYYGGIPKEIEEEALSYLDDRLNGKLATLRTWLYSS